MMLSRRAVLAGSLAALAAPRNARAATPNVVVLGGGAGGATAARALKAFGDDGVSVTLIEADPTYVTCFFSNWVIGGLRSLADITHSYARFADIGVRVVTDRATAIDRDGKKVVLAGGDSVSYDRLIVAPGIDFAGVRVPGYSAAVAAAMPHGWKAGPQTVEIVDRLAALDDGDPVVMVVPADPYRCPPGPYERASVFAHVLATTGRTRCRITILDGKAKFSKQALFQAGWESHYPGMIEWLSPDIHGGITGLDPATGTVETGFGPFTGKLVNLIPPQTAGAIARDAGLADGDWCLVDPRTMRSLADPAIHVVGDSAKAGAMPKSAFAANSQAKVAALAVLADLVGRPAVEPRYFNTCWSLIAPDDAVKVGALYTIGEAGIEAAKPLVSGPDESPAERRLAAEEAIAWYAAITADMFGG